MMHFFITMIIDMFTNELNIFFFLIFMVIIFCYWFYCSRKISALKEEISISNSNLNKYNVENAIEKYQEMDEYFLNTSLLSSTWKLFRNTLSKIHLKTNEYKIFSTHDTDEFFNIAQLTEANNINIAFWQNLGSIFTGFGILGTFIGLTHGISGINLKEVSSIGNLLNGLQSAFGTSIWGIIFAISFNFTHNLIIEGLKKSLYTLSQKIESLYPHCSTEQILLETLEHAREQSSQLKKFNSQLAIEIGDAVSAEFQKSSFAANIQNIDTNTAEIYSYMQNTLPNVINNAIEAKLTPVFHELNEAIFRLNNSGLQGVSDSIQAGVGKEMQAFADTLQNMSDSLSKVILEMQKTSTSVNNDLTSSIENVIAKLETTTNKIMEASDKQNNKIQESSLQFADSVNNVSTNIADILNQHYTDNIAFAKQIEDTLTNVQNNLNAQTVHISSIADVMQSIISEATETANAFNKAAMPISSASQSLERSLNVTLNKTNEFEAKIYSSIATLHSTTKQTEDNLTEITKNINTAQQLLKNTSSEYLNINDELEKMLETLKKQVEEHNRIMFKNYEDNLKVYSMKLGQAYQDLSGAISELSEAIEDIPQK